MNDVIEFKRTQEFLGRNGVFRMSGLVVDRQGDSLYLAPVTSKGVIGRAYLLVPREHVQEVTDLMLRVVNHGSVK